MKTLNRVPNSRIGIAVVVTVIAFVLIAMFSLRSYNTDKNYDDLSNDAIHAAMAIESMENLNCDWTPAQTVSDDVASLDCGSPDLIVESADSNETLMKWYEDMDNDLADEGLSVHVTIKDNIGYASTDGVLIEMIYNDLGASLYTVVGAER